ncbi:MAG TPA: glutaredoxin family protein [Dehalococcoidia bacterium]
MKVKQVLDDNKIPYKYLDVSRDKIARDEMVSKTGKLVVPVVDVDGEVSIGYDEKWLKEKLNLS